MCRKLVLLLALVATVGPTLAADLTGTVRLERRGRTAPGVEEVVISFSPEAVVAPEPLAEPFEMAMIGKQFEPPVLVLPVGSRVVFPNRDSILHNIFSVSRPNDFDLGLYGQGSGDEVTFEHPGIVRVFCNVHHSMVAYVVVLGTSFWARPDADGRFRITGAPAGVGTLTAWFERAEEVSETIELPLEKPVEIALEITKARVPRHKNKVGKPYSGRQRYE